MFMYKCVCHGVSENVCLSASVYVEGGVKSVACPNVRFHLCKLKDISHLQ